MIAQWSDREVKWERGRDGIGKIRKLGFELGSGTNFLVLFYTIIVFMSSLK